MPPRLARLLAVLVAIALIVGAFVLRGALAGDDEETDVKMDTDVPGLPDDPRAADLRIACDEDLAPVCEVLGVDPIRASEVLDSEDDIPYDAWLTLDPMPAALDSRRSFAGRPRATSGEPVAVASSGLTLLTFQERGVACEDEWRCVIEAAAEQSIGVPRGDSAAGMVVAGAALLQLAGEDTVERRGIGALEEGDVRARLLDLTERQDDLLELPGRMVTQRGSYAGVVTTSGLAALRAERNPAGGLYVVYLPGVTVGVVLVGLGAEGEEAVAALQEVVSGQTVLDALAEAGWGGDPERSSGLPDADVIDALREDLGS